MVQVFWPLGNGRVVTSPFGPRAGGFHAGVDFGRAGGSGRMPVYAVQSGTVLFTGSAEGYGGPDPCGWIVVQSDTSQGGGCWEYGHIVRLPYIKPGVVVEAGKQIASVNPDRGTNGGVAPHLHVSFMPARYNPRQKIDPMTRLGGAREPEFVAKEIMTEKVLPYDRAIVPQETGWWCGPAAVQIALNSRGIKIPEREIAADIEQIENPGRGDDRDGTDYIGHIETYLDRKVPEARYTSVYMPNDPPTQVQKDRLWRHIVQSIDAGWPVIVNIVAPPNNLPAAVKGSKPPPYPRHLTTYHYACIAGYDSSGSRAVWWADSAAFGGITGWWGPFDGRGSVATLIPPKGYCFADVVAPKPDAAKPVPPMPVPEPVKPDIAAAIRQSDWENVWASHVEHLAFEYADLAAVDWLVRKARTNDARAMRALARLEKVNPAALHEFLMKG